MNLAHSISRTVALHSAGSEVARAGVMGSRGYGLWINTAAPAVPS